MKIAISMMAVVVTVVLCGCSEFAEGPDDPNSVEPASVSHNRELSEYLSTFLGDGVNTWVIDFTKPVTISSSLVRGLEGELVYGFDYQSGVVMPEVKGRVTHVGILEPPPSQDFPRHLVHVRVEGKMGIEGFAGRKGRTVGRATTMHSPPEDRTGWTVPPGMQGDWRYHYEKHDALFKVSNQFVEFRTDATDPTKKDKRVVHEHVIFQVKLASPEEIAKAVASTSENNDGRWEWGKTNLLRISLRYAEDDEKKNLFEEQLTWFRKAAEKGHVISQQAIIAFYDSSSEQGAFHGDAVEQYAWTKVSIFRYENVETDRDEKEIDRLLHPLRRSSDKATNSLAAYKASLESIELTPEELTQAKALAAEYIEKYVPRKE
ncbi:MAG: hypothetical protein P8L85_15085 [Rubripirellula sp.]|nr:hypothetical protein [Rubripirellula sp.]